MTCRAGRQVRHRRDPARRRTAAPESYREIRGNARRDHADAPPGRRAGVTADVRTSGGNALDRPGRQGIPQGTSSFAPVPPRRDRRSAPRVRARRRTSVRIHARAVARGDTPRAPEARRTDDRSIAPMGPVQAVRRHGPVDPACSRPSPRHRRQVRFSSVSGPGGPFPGAPSGHGPGARGREHGTATAFSPGLIRPREQRDEPCRGFRAAEPGSPAVAGPGPVRRHGASEAVAALPARGTQAGCSPRRDHGGGRTIAIKTAIKPPYGGAPPGEPTGRMPPDRRGAPCRPPRHVAALGIAAAVLDIGPGGLTPRSDGSDRRID